MRSAIVVGLIAQIILGLFFAYDLVSAVTDPSFLILEGTSGAIVFVNSLLLALAGCVTLGLVAFREYRSVYSSSVVGL